MTSGKGRRAFAVLAVEDDPMLLADMVDLIEDLGFTAYEARGADAALRLMEAHADIRVLFTDVEMPGSMDGLKLAHAVRDRWPPVTIIVASARHGLRQSDLPVRGTLFAKPYAPNGIIGALNGAAALAGH